MAQQQNRKAPVRKTKKQIRRQRQLTVVGVVDAYYGWSQAADLGNFTIMYQGSVKIGSDTSTLTADKVKIDGKSVTITVPAIKILQHDIAQDSISYYDSDEKVFRQIELGQYDSFYADQRSAVENELYNTDKFSNAETRLKDVIDKTVKAMGNFSTVTVNFE